MAATATKSGGACWPAERSGGRKPFRRPVLFTGSIGWRPAPMLPSSLLRARRRSFLPKRDSRYVVVTSSGGCSAARYTDWTPLAGRPVVTWRDADQSGLDYEGEVVAELLKIGAGSVRSV
jgi:hypothetical protein